MTLLYGLLVGVVMGVLLQRVQASSPGVIARTLRLEDLTIIKFMALTIAVGAVVAYALQLALSGMLFAAGVFGAGIVTAKLMKGGH